MSNMESGKIKIRQLPKSIQSFEEMFEKIVDDDVRTDIASLNSQLFELSPNCNDESYDINQVKKQTDSFIVKLPQNVDMFNSTLKSDIEENYCNHSLDCGHQYQSNSENKNFDRYLSTQDSLCTECQFDNRLNSFFSSINNTQCQTQSSYFPFVINQIIETRNRDQYDGKRFFRKRSLSVTPERRYSKQLFPSQKCLKKFKSEQSISTIKKERNNICKIIKPITITRKISMQNFSNIDQTTKLFARVCDGIFFPKTNHNNDLSIRTIELEKTFSKLSDYDEGLPDASTLHQVYSEGVEHTEGVENRSAKNPAQNVEEISVIENISPDNEIDRGSLNKIILSQSQNLGPIHSNCSHSTFSQSSNEETYYIDDADEIDHSKSDRLMKEMQETHGLNCNNSLFSQSTIEEVYYIDTADDIDCSPHIQATSEMPQYETAEENFMRSIINDEIIRDEEIMVTTVIGICLQPLVNSLPREMKIKENKPMHLSCTKNLESITNTRTDDNIESQCLIEAQLKKTDSNDKMIAKHIVPVYLIDDPVRDVDSVKDPEFRNRGVLKFPDESVLEISINSESDQIIPRDTIDEKEKISSVHAANNIKPNSTYSNIVSKDKRGTRNGPVDLTIVNTHSSPLENVIPLKDINTENVETKSTLDDFYTQFLTQTQFDAIERQVEMVTTKIDSANSTPHPAANETPMKDSNISSRDVKNLRDNLSLEFLSESELERIEEEAYNTKEKETSSINLKNVTKSVQNEQIVFCNPERSTMLIEKGNDDLVLPNWVTNPAPEPNYNKMKCTIQMRREYMKKMLDGILKLSTIISKLRGIVCTEHQHRDSEAVKRSCSQVQDLQPIRHTTNHSNNGSVELGGSNHTLFNLNSCGNIVTTNLGDNNIFYVPQSSRSQYNAPCNIAITSANTVTIEDLKSNGKFYTPGLNGSEYDVPPIFNRPSEIEFKRGTFSSSYMQTNTLNMFGSLKNNINGNGTCEPDISSIWYSGRESKTGIQNRKATISLKNKSVSNMNKVETFNNDTMFYLPDKLSSASDNYTTLPGAKNSQILSSLIYTKQSASTHMKLYEQRPLNFGKNLDPQADSNDDSIFYNGNKESGMNFKTL